jgi:hypothetical protein
MSIKSSSREPQWIALGAVGLLVAFFTTLYLRGDRDPVAQIAFKERRLAVVNGMRLSLASASEGQNSAVLSTGEQDSIIFADEARSAMADLERGRIELKRLLKEHAGPQEMELMDQVDRSLREFQQIDEQLLDLAIQSSNRKAFGLAFGPAMKLLKEMDEPLFRIVANSVDLPADNQVRVVQLANEARVGILRTQVLLLPHIAEVNDQKMDEFEQELSAVDRRVREALGALRVLLPESEKINIETTTLRYAEFENLKTEILTLSRQNTDVRAAAIVLKEKRKAMLACEDALIALEHAIRVEPITSTIPSGRSPQ